MIKVGFLAALFVLWSTLGALAQNEAFFSPGVNFADQSAVVGSPQSFFYPSYFGNPATGRVFQANRLQLGAESLASGDINSASPQRQSTPSWVGHYLGSMGYATLAATNVLGEGSVVAANRTSDYHAFTGGHSGGPGAVIGIGVNDDTTGGNPIACAVCAVAIQVTGNTGGITLSQFDIANQSPVVIPTPNNGVAAGSTFALGLTAGAGVYGGSGNNNATAAFYVGNGIGSNTAFEVGGIFFKNSLDATQGIGGAGVALEYYTGMSQRWLGASNGVVAELWGDATGLNVANNLVLSAGAVASPAAGTAVLNARPGNGAVVAGSGTNYDVVLANSATTPVAFVFHNSTTFGLAGSLTATGSLAAQTANGIPAGGSNAFGVTFSSTANFGVFFGSGAPTLSAAQGSLYLRSDGSSTLTRAYINTNGSTGWTNLVTGS